MGPCSLLLNQCWRLSCQREASLFRQACHDPQAAQERTLRRILSIGADQQWGRRWGLSRHMSIAEFRARVPVTNYEDYRTAIERILEGDDNPLTRESVDLLEPTSGSTSSAKLIPYTRSLRCEFRRALAVWIADLFGRRPDTMRGRAYWAVSPACHPTSVTAHGIRIGFEDDTSYLGPLARWIVQPLLAVPPCVARLPRGVDWQYVSLWYLLQANHLSLVSIWSPTFLISMLSSLEDWRESLARDLADGICRPAGEGANQGILSQPARRTQAGQHASRWLGQNLALSELTRRLWPSLAAISCWTEGASRRYVPPLRELFPHAEILPKGLLSTEGIVSIPLVDEPGGALALRSHFLEFQPLNSTATALAHELAVGQRYRVILTTGGGLYRYRTGDVIDVVGARQRCPLVQFVGREATSDMVGEKLEELFVREVLDQTLGAFENRLRFALLVPNEDERRYQLYLDLDLESDPQTCDGVRSLEEDLERRLSANPYYRQARELKQLAAARLVMARTARGTMRRIYDAICLATATRPGDLKPVSLEIDARRARDFSIRLAQESCESTTGRDVGAS